MLERKIRFFLILLLSACIFSCVDNSKKMQEKWLLYKNFSMQLATQELYEQVYHEANDSIINWLSNDLSLYAYEKNNDWRLDYLLCFNRHLNKCIMTLMVRDTLYKPANSDAISYLYGVKIKNSWYFFLGAQMIVPRNYYQNDTHIPLSFEKLKEIATYNIYKGYLFQNRQGQWEINDNFFSTFDRDAYNFPFTTQEAWDESWLKLCKENWQRKNTQ